MYFADCFAKFAGETFWCTGEYLTDLSKLCMLRAVKCARLMVRGWNYLCTAATLMNAQWSRLHPIFTSSIERVNEASAIEQQASTNAKKEHIHAGKLALINGHRRLRAPVQNRCAAALSLAALVQWPLSFSRILELLFLFCCALYIKRALQLNDDVSCRRAELSDMWTHRICTLT